jgi:hypothetical protein
MVVGVGSSIAIDKTAPGSSGHPDAQTKGTYTVVDSNTDLGYGGYYGLACKRNKYNSIWISSWEDGTVYEHRKSDLGATGNYWFFDAADCDMDDLGWFGGTDKQWVGGGYTNTNWFSFWEEDGTYIGDVDSPAGWDRVMAATASSKYGMIYCATGDELAYGSYDGDPGNFSGWTTTTTTSCYGLAAWRDYLVAFCALSGEDNIFFYPLDGSGVPNTGSPYWSCEFVEEDPTTTNAGGVDFDGHYLYVMPQNGGLYKLDPDVVVGIKSASLGEIKANFR